MALSSSQKRKAREKLAKKRGVSPSRISDLEIFDAVDTGFLTTADYASSSSYDCGSSPSSCDSGSSSSSSCDSSGE